MDDQTLADAQRDRYRGPGAIDVMPCTTPSREGWYLARMKSRATYEGREFVKVTRVDSRNFEVWQPGDTRPWRVDQFDWFAQVFP